MERVEALDGLSSDATAIRLAAARWFAIHAVAEDAQVLQSSLNKESVPWIKRALGHALDRVRKGVNTDPVLHDSTSSAHSGTTNSQEDLTSENLAKITERVTEQLLHEISPLVGALRSATEREWRDFRGSDTERILDQTARLMSSLRELNTAYATPKFENIVLSELVRELIVAFRRSKDVRIQEVGSPSLVVEADRGKLEIAVSNGLRNAFESTYQSNTTEAPLVIVTWGVTGEEVWLAIKDNGPGFPTRDPRSYIKRGTTTKTGHLGYGLTLVSAVMESMGGELILLNSPPGAHFEIRWFRRNADPSR